MKTVKKQVEEILNQEFLGHPSRESDADIDRLKQIVLVLAQQIDDIIQYRASIWQIESVERYYQAEGRNSWGYHEITHWFNSLSCERKETSRYFSIFSFQEHLLPEWAKGITKRLKTALDDKIY